MVIGDSFNNGDAQYPNPPWPPHRSYTSLQPPQQPRYATRQSSGQRRPVNEYTYEPRQMDTRSDWPNRSQNRYHRPAHKVTWDESPMDTRPDWPARSQNQYSRRAPEQLWDGSPMDTRSDWSTRARGQPRSGSSRNPFHQFLDKDSESNPPTRAEPLAQQQPGRSALEPEISPPARACSMLPGCSGRTNNRPRVGTPPPPPPPPAPEPEHLDDITAAAIANIIMSVISDKTSYRKLLQIDRSRAQRLVDISQAVLESPSLDAKPRRELVVSMQRFSKSTIVYPRSYRLETVKLSSGCIGEGSFGAVYRGIYQRRDVCLKALKNDGRTKPEKLIKAFAREAILWRQLSHSNILPFYGICELDIGMCMVSPWMCQGNLREYIKGLVSPQGRLLIARDVAEGLKYLHSYDIVHGDLKGENVLIDGVGRARIADFGLTSVDDPAIEYWSSQRKAASRGGTVAFMAPEIVSAPEDVDNKNTMASDMYSWGCVCYELYVGEEPYKSSRNQIILQKLRNELPKRPEDKSSAWKSRGLTETMWSFMDKAWSTQPELRPDASETVERLSEMIDDDPRPQEENEQEPEAGFIRRWCHAPTGDDMAPSGMRQEFKIPTVPEVEELLRLP